MTKLFDTLRHFPLALGILFWLSSAAAAHSAIADGYGCHRGPDKVSYHCHQGEVVQELARRLTGTFLRDAKRAVSPYVRLPFADLANSQWQLKELLGDATYDREGNDLQGRGLYLDERPWSARFFALTRL